MGPFGGDKHKVTLPKQELDFIDSPVMHEDFYIMQKLCHTIADSGFVPDHKIPGKELLASTVVPTEVKGLVVLAHQRFIFLRVLQVPRLCRSVGLAVPAQVRWSVHGREGPVLYDQAVLKPEDVEEDVSSGSLPIRMGHDISPSSSARTTASCS
jgi:hypothetical protein